jgi:hypothetical protein
VTLDESDAREALETLRTMRAACMADLGCPPDALRAFNLVIADYERKAAA